MINYTRMRESVEKNSSKKSLSKGLTASKSHTSSINIKLSQDLSTLENIKMPMKSVFKERCEPYLQTVTKQAQVGGYGHSHKKHSVKLQSNEKENMGKRRDVKESYEVGLVRPFQETNRYLETQRMNKENQRGQRSISKSKGFKIKNEHTQVKMKTEYTEVSAEKYKKDSLTKQTSTNSSNIAKIPLQELHGLMQELYKEQREIQELKRQLAFYKKHADKDSNNPLVRALKA